MSYDQRERDRTATQILQVLIVWTVTLISLASIHLIGLPKWGSGLTAVSVLLVMMGSMEIIRRRGN